jgi:hypothetical protein
VSSPRSTTTVGKSLRTPKGFRQSGFQRRRIGVAGHAPYKRLSGLELLRLSRQRMTKREGERSEVV